MFYLNDRPIWEEEGRDWPHSHASRFVETETARWHVLDMGTGPTLLLVHGTGAANHSFRAVADRLSKRFRVLAPDLLGHGFTAPRDFVQLSLPNVAKALGDLIDALDVKPAIAVGHSAGAAILTRMVLDGRITPKALVSLNGAFLPFKGFAGQIFPSMARMLFLNPLAPRAFAWRAGDRGSVERLIKSTGSEIDAHGVELYARLLRRAGHVAGALGMMAHWDLEPLIRDVPNLKTPLILYASEGDRAVPVDAAFEMQRRFSGVEVVRAPDLGHLAHEESPEEAADLIERVADAHGVAG